MEIMTMRTTRNVINKSIKFLMASHKYKGQNELSKKQGAIDSTQAVVLPLAFNLCFMTIIDCLQKSYLLQVIELIDRGYLVNPQPEQSLQEISSQFNDALRLHPPERNTETKVCAYFW